MIKTKNDYSNPGMKVGFTEDGMIFKVPLNIRAGKVRVTLNNEKNGKKYYNYVGEA